MNQPRREKISRTKVFSIGSFLNCNRVIFRIVQQNSPTCEPEPRVFFEAAYNRIKEITGWIAVIVRKSNDVSL
jgi:hypothetical protein